jgi:hypothetical protein
MKSITIKSARIVEPLMIDIEKLQGWIGHDRSMPQAITKRREILVTKRLQRIV